jgi:hypothetical protein
MKQAIGIFIIGKLLFISMSCNSEKKLENFNSDLWKNDPKACLSFRVNIAPSLLEQRANLLGWSDAELVKVLGKPDQTDLQNRGQKYYLYFIEPGSQCSDIYPTIGKKIKIRFSALNLVNEVFVE